MPTVNFDRLAASPRQYEEMVTVLLSRLRGARRVDGSGGDRGVDAWFRDDSGLHIYELKSFVGRVNRSQRRQVERSLTRALTHGPATWTLVVPVDFTPAEQEWFDSLRASAPQTELRYHDRTWLENQLAAHPDIGRYFAGAAEEVVDLLTQLRDEQALPETADVAVQRVRGVVNRLNEIDPYYRFEVAVGANEGTVTVHPRYPGAERDRPITVSAQLRFDEDTEVGRDSLRSYREHLTFGLPVTLPADVVGDVTIDAPAGLGGTFSQGTLSLSGAIEPPPDADRELIIRTPRTGRPQALLRLNLTERFMGQGGLCLRASDDADMLRVELRADMARQTMACNISHTFQPDVSPRAALPVLRMMAALRTGAEVTFTRPNGDHLASGSPGPFTEDPDHLAYLEIVAQLAELEELSGIGFTTPQAITPSDRFWLNFAVAMLRGERRTSQWRDEMTVTLSKPSVHAVIEDIGRVGNPCTLFFKLPVFADVFDRRVPLGMLMRVHQSARVLNIDEAITWAETATDDENFNLRVTPGNSNDLTIYRIDEDVAGADDE